MSIALFGFLRSKLKKLQLATEKRLSPLEEQFHALARANINMEPTVEESATGGIAALPKNAADGPFSRFVLKGNTRLSVAENILKSGNFQDMSHWDISGIDPERLYPYGNVLTINFAGDEHYFYMTQSLPTKQGHRYYIRGEIQCVNCGIEIIAGSAQFGVYDNQEYELVSFVVEYPNSLSFTIAGFYDDNPKCYLRRWMVVDLGDGNSPLYNKTTEELDAMFTTYFDGTYTYAPIQHTSGSYRIRRVGKNLWGGRKLAEYIVKIYNDPNIATIVTFEGKECLKIVSSANIPYNFGFNIFEPNTQYTFSAFAKQIGSASGHIFGFEHIDGSRVIVSSMPTDWGKVTVTSSVNKTVLALRSTVQSTGITTYYDVDTMQLEKGTTATPYEPYSAQDVYVNCGELRRLPNGTYDEYSVLEGIKTERTEIGTIGEEKVPQPLDFTSGWSVIGAGSIVSSSSFSTGSSIGGIYKSISPANAWLLIEIAGVSSGRLQIRNSVNTTGHFILPPGNFNTKRLVNWNGPTNLYLCLLDTDTSCTITKLSIKVVSVNGMPVNPSEVIVDGTKVAYQLAKPIITPYYPQALTSKPSGTIFCEPVLGDADFYGQGIVLEGYAFVGIEKVTKVDLESGVEIDVTDTCTLNAEKNGFTSTELQPNDICWYELHIDPETTLIPEMEYAYYDSRYVVVDDSNGKYYSWKIASTNGTPRIVLEEV